MNNGNANVIYDGFSYTHAMGMLLLDFVLYLALALYFDQVLQGDYGVALPWYFPLQPSYWCPRPTALAEQEVNESELPASSVMEPVDFSDSERAAHQLGVRIRRLGKEFRPDKSLPPFKAVDDLSVDMYTGQVFALLGHNGAGKTTTLSMLSGLLPCTSGEARVFGQSIRTQMPLIRETLGVCPQFNIIWPTLSVHEHLHIYGAVKGIPRGELQRAVDEMIEQVGLTEKRHVASAALSGGMQRKLSVAIALIGDSKIVFLDEPTSGMDPYSRRATWDLLKKKKEGRVIILTTHFMVSLASDNRQQPAQHRVLSSHCAPCCVLCAQDEADSLGDRIAIMAAGRLQCVGSSLFLKTRFGVGYSLVLTKAGGQCDEAAIQAAIEERVDNAELVNNIAGELSFKLPFAAEPQFPELFDAFDAHQQAWGIQSYGISVTTLEEVYLKVGKDAAAHARIHGLSRGNSKLIPGSVAADNQAVEEEKASASGVHTVQVKPRDEQPYAHNALSSPTPRHQHLTELASPATSSRSDLLAGVPLSSPSAAKPLNSPGAAAGSGPGSPLGGMRSTTVDALGHGVLYDKRHPNRRHIRALLIKRYQNAKRNRKNWCWTIIIPFVIMILFLGIINGLNNVDTSVEGVTFGDLNSPEQLPYAVVGNSTQFMSTVAGETGGSTVVQPLDVTAQVADPANATQFAEWLYASEAQLQLSRYGAIVYQAQTHLGDASLPLVADNAAVYTNTTYLFSLPLYYSTYNTALLRHLTGSSTAQIAVQMWPFPVTANAQVLQNSITAIVIG